MHSRRQSALQAVATSSTLPNMKKRLVLTGQVFHKSGGGVGMYMRYLDAEGEVANIIDDKGKVREQLMGEQTAQGVLDKLKALRG